MPSRPVLICAVAMGLAACALGGSTRSSVDLALEGAGPEPAGRAVPSVEAAFALVSCRASVPRSPSPFRGAV